MTDHAARLDYMATMDMDQFMDYPVKDFLLVLRAISAQRFGRLFEKYLVYKGYFSKSLSGIGDAHDPETNTAVEIKSSMPRPGQQFNFVQIRPHEVCDLALFAINTDGSVSHWRVPHGEVLALVSTFGTSAHGMMDKDDPRQEYALRFKPGSDIAKLMDKRYTAQIELED